ncbi:glycosyltransferase [Limibacterium fermenti]|uniref:glycosyltransferase n=1 Tax=Limibacterium fermenti TaxID=3229863 RepID=UPI000E8588CB|nr:glycosyl transferase family 2 [Porphyromonadaceae bacterium]HBX45504.1 glycosyl transferase family 2 [Porphyromonadaceae bacterium]
MDFSTISFSGFSVIEWSLVSALLFFFLTQLFFSFFLYRKPYAHGQKNSHPDEEGIEWPGVSVIISSRDNSENLAKNLPAILEQDYPRFEVIVVNRGSTLETDLLLQSLEQKYEHLYHTYVPAEAERVNEKKLALMLGIKAAKNDILLFTEAYCKPCSDQWIKAFAREFIKGNDIVLGYCKLHIKKKCAMRHFILFDNLIYSLKYLSMALRHKPFMGNGRNMAYRKQLFYKANGFSSVLNMNDGEDDLFVNRVATSDNTGVVVSPQSMTESDTITSFADWKMFKSRYIYGRHFYKGGASAFWRWETLSKYAFYVLLLGTLIWSFLNGNGLLFLLAVLLFVGRYGSQLILLNKSSKWFDAGKFHINLLFFDLFQPVSNIRLRKYAKGRGHNKRYWSY